MTIVCLFFQLVSLLVFTISEELKYAQSIGYTIIPPRGYLYEKGFVG